LRFSGFDVFARAWTRSENLNGGYSSSSFRPRNQTLGNNVTKSLGQTCSNYRLFTLWIKADDAVDSLGRIDCVQRGQHQVTCFRCLKGDLSRFIVSHLTDQNHLRRLPQSGTKCGRKVSGVMPDFALIYRRVFVIVKVFDGVLNRNDVEMLLLVDHVDNGRLRGTLARAGGSSYQHETVAKFCHIPKLFR